MSGRSPTTRQLLTAGLVGVGVGVLAAGVGYAIATSNSPTNCSLQPYERRGCRSENSHKRERSPRNAISYNERSENSYERERSPRKDIAYNESERCKICGVDMSSEPSVALTCNHSFHKKCLFSSYVVQTQVNKGCTFQCPFEACQVEIPENVLESLLAVQ